MFTNEEKGYMYIDIKQTSSKCARLTINNVPQKIPYSKDQLILDFTMKDSPSHFKVDYPEHDIMMACSFQKFHSESKQNEKFDEPILVQLSGVLKDAKMVRI